MYGKYNTYISLYLCPTQIFLKAILIFVRKLKQVNIS